MDRLERRVRVAGPDRQQRGRRAGLGDREAVGAVLREHAVLGGDRPCRARAPAGAGRAAGRRRSRCRGGRRSGRRRGACRTPSRRPPGCRRRAPRRPRSRRRSARPARAPARRAGRSPPGRWRRATARTRGPSVPTSASMTVSPTRLSMARADEQIAQHPQSGTRTRRASRCARRRRARRRGRRGRARPRSRRSRARCSRWAGVSTCPLAAAIKPSSHVPSRVSTLTGWPTGCRRSGPSAGRPATGRAAGSRHR